jgi:hypothetical protein
MPARLPGLALDLPLLLDLERATAILAAVGSVLIFAVFTSRGYLPTLLGNMLGINQIVSTNLNVKSRRSTGGTSHGSTSSMTSWARTMRF